jgi:hypothetical protein
VPQEIISATCEAAVREMASPGTLMPDLERGGSIQALQAGSVRIEYAANASSVTLFSLIDGIIANVLTGKNSGLFHQAVRG